MSRPAMKWSYGEEVLKLGLSASELAVLRALCWHTNPKLGYCPVITDEDLMFLTGYTGRQTFTSARKRLKALGLISYEHENKAKDQARENFGSSNGYVYFVHFTE